MHVRRLHEGFCAHHFELYGAGAPLLPCSSRIPRQKMLLQVALYGDRNGWSPVLTMNICACYVQFHATLTGQPWWTSLQVRSS